MSAALDIVDADIAYPGREVLHDVSLSVDRGEVLAVVGPNGVGKSSLVRCASGTMALVRGRVLVEGLSLAEMRPSERARKIAVVPQAIHIPPRFTAHQVVMMGRTPYLGWLEREGERDYSIVEGAMERTFTLDLAKRPMGELSGGEQQRVLVARGLAQAPQVLLLDEPTAHLDLQHQADVLGLVRSLVRDQGMAVMIALHDLNLVSRFADRVGLLSNGHIRAMGNPKQVLTPSLLEEAYGVRIQVIDHPVHGTPLVLPP